MILEIFVSSLALALIFMPLLAWKWRINMKLAIISAIIIGGFTGLIVHWIAPRLPGLGLGVLFLLELFLIFLLVFLAIILRFYRDPERTPLETENVILSPADGQVIYVNKVEKGSSLVSTKGKKNFKLDEITTTSLLDNPAYLIGIDMNMLNVHVNRSPVSGKLIFQKHIKGKFISLRKEESDILNERVIMVIENGNLRFGVIQIASRLVRRILSYMKEGDSLQIGQRIGAIVFGSQVDVVVPNSGNLRIEARPGDEVKAGISVVARYGS